MKPGKTRVTVELPIQEADEFENLCHEKEMSKSAMFREMIAFYSVVDKMGGKLDVRTPSGEMRLVFVSMSFGGHRP